LAYQPSRPFASDTQFRTLHDGTVANSAELRGRLVIVAVRSYNEPEDPFGTHPGMGEDQRSIGGLPEV
jgi:hypothetical protein